MMSMLPETSRTSRIGSHLSLQSVEDQEEWGRTDLEGLLAFFDTLTSENIRLTEVTYCVNRWKLYGVIGLKHHGFILPCGRFGFLSLDFTSKGILWDVDDDFPELADDTCIAKSYMIDAYPTSVKRYCKNTKPFTWHSNDCSTWAAGLLKVLGVHDRKGLQRTDTVANLLELEGFVDNVNRSDKRRDACKPCARSTKMCLITSL